MRKVLVLAAVAALMISSTGLAQDSTLFLDIRNNVSPDQLIGAPVYPYINGALNGGMAGDAQTLWITPVYSTGFEGPGKLGFPNNDGDGYTSTGALWLYMDVNNAASGGTGVISSIGLDMPITAPATPRNILGSVAYAWDTTAPIAWSGTAPGTGSPTGVVGSKAVKVPVVSGTPSPVFDTTGGLVPTARYRIGNLSITGGLRECTFGTGHTANSTYSLKLTVNGLLITRVFSGVSPDPTENIAFGYAGGVPEAPYVDGSVSGGTSPLPDATIVVASKGDNNGDGRILNTDVPGFNTAKLAGTGLTQLQAFLNDSNGDRRVLNTDIPGFNAAKANSPTCP